jgi:hypothetical protein
MNMNKINSFSLEGLQELEKQEMTDTSGGVVGIVGLYLATFAIEYTIGKDLKCGC